MFVVVVRRPRERGCKAGLVLGSFSLIGSHQVFLFSFLFLVALGFFLFLFLNKCMVSLLLFYCCMIL